MTNWPPMQERGHCGNIYVRQLSFTRPGQIMPAHRHNFDHATFVWEGSIRVRLVQPDGSESEETYTAPEIFNVPAHVGHEISALTRIAIIYCIFAVRDKDGQVAMEVTDEHRRDWFYHFPETPEGDPRPGPVSPFAPIAEAIARLGRGSSE